MRALSCLAPIEASKGLEQNLSYNITNYLGVPPKDLDGTQISEAAAFIYEKFPSLGLSDVWQAFKMVAAEKLEVDLTAYYGRFSIVGIGKMLNAYKAYRNNILSQIQDEMNESEKREREEQLKEELNAKARADALNEFKISLKCREEGMPTFKHWEQVPTNWAQILKDAGQLPIIPQEQTQALILEAKQIAFRKLQSIIISTTARSHEKAEAMQMIKRINSKTPCEDYKAKWLNIYFKLRVWELVKPLEDEAQM